MIRLEYDSLHELLEDIQIFEPKPPAIPKVFITADQIYKLDIQMQNKYSDPKPIIHLVNNMLTFDGCNKDCIHYENLNATNQFYDYYRSIAIKFNKQIKELLK